jgi:hypothetical protein
MNQTVFYRLIFIDLNHTQMLWKSMNEMSPTWELSLTKLDSYFWTTEFCFYLVAQITQ